MIAMIAWRKNCLGGVFALQHSTRMRHANKEHGVLARVSRGVLHRATGVLFENVINVLHACDVAFANAVDAFVEPANRRTERDAVIANFSRALQLIERLPNRVVVSLLHPNVV